MVRFGTLKDFNNAKKKLEAAGHKVTVTKSKSDLVRQLMVGDKAAVSIARLGGKNWSFIYDVEFWQDDFKKEK